MLPALPGVTVAGAMTRTGGDILFDGPARGLCPYRDGIHLQPVSLAALRSAAYPRGVHLRRAFKMTRRLNCITPFNGIAAALQRYFIRRRH